MNDIWVSSDWHLVNRDHNDTRHPFKSKEWLAQMATNYHTMIDASDLFIFLGDLCDPDAVSDEQWQSISDIIKGIPGHRIMCKGNHDTLDNSYYYALGFDMVCDIGQVEHMVFSHKPVRVNRDEVNIHAHLHFEKDTKLGYQHINVYQALVQNGMSIDKPILLQDLFDAADQQNHDAEPDWGTYDPERSHFTDMKSCIELKNAGAYVADLSEYFVYGPVDESAMESDIEDDFLDEVLFPDVASTKYWEADDDAAQKEEDAATYDDSKPVRKIQNKNDVIAEATYNKFSIDSINKTTTNGFKNISANIVDNNAVYTMTMLAEDILSDEIRINPEQIPKEEIRLIRDMDQLIARLAKFYQDAKTSIDYTKNASASFSLLYPVMIDGSTPKTFECIKKMLPEYCTNFDVANYVQSIMDQLYEIEQLMVEAFKMNAESAYIACAKDKAACVDPNQPKEIIKALKKYVDSKDRSDIIVNIDSSGTAHLDYSAFGGGDVYIAKEVMHELDDKIYPSRFLVRSRIYDIIIIAHGHPTVGSDWDMSRIVINGKKYTKVEQLSELIQQNPTAKVLLLICNEKGTILNSAEFPENQVRYSMTKTIFESAAPMNISTKEVIQSAKVVLRVMMKRAKKYHKLIAAYNKIHLKLDTKKFSLQYIDGFPDAKPHREEMTFKEANSRGIGTAMFANMDFQYNRILTGTIDLLDLLKDKYSDNIGLYEFAINTEDPYSFGRPNMYLLSTGFINPLAYTVSDVLYETVQDGLEDAIALIEAWGYDECETCNIRISSIAPEDRDTPELTIPYSNAYAMLEQVLDEAAGNYIRVDKRETINPNDKKSNKAVDLTFYKGRAKIGVASISGYDTNSGFLYDLEVSEKYRGQGYGKYILNYVIHNYNVTDLSVAEDNITAIKLYESFGFKLKKTFNSNGENGYEVGTFRWYQLDPRTQYLYHGSPNKMIRIDPANNSGMDQPYVFGSPDRNFSLCYAGNPWHDGIINQGYIDDELYLIEIEPGAFKKTFDRDGYLYTLNTTDFSSKLNNHEYTSKCSISPIAYEYIPNVYSAIKAAGIKLYPYGKWPKHHKYKNREEYINAKLSSISESTKEYKNLDNLKPMDREEKRKVAEKYGLRVVGAETPTEREENNKTPEQRYRERREKQLSDLKRARKIKKRKAFVRKIKSRIPGMHESTAVEEPKISDEDTGKEQSPLYGEKNNFFYNYDYPKTVNAYAERLKLEESAVQRVNDEGKEVPEVCPKCGAKIGLYLKGEPVWLCSNKKCEAYYGTAPCNETTTQVVDDPITLAELKALGIRDLRTFQRWLKNNVKYENMTTLKTPRQVLESKRGCCHDQTNFELAVLKLLGYQPRAYFVMEFKGRQGGETHSYVVIEDNKTLYWLENAWDRYAGLNQIDRPTFIKQAHEERAWGNIERFPEIEVVRFVAEPGDDLQTIVDKSVNAKKPVNESSEERLIKSLYFISETPIDSTTSIVPRIPNNFMTRNGYEDNTTPRVCFSTSIDGCLTGLSMNVSDKTFYVYHPISNARIITPTIKQVPDVKITNERWICDSVHLHYVGKIKAFDENGPKDDGIPYRYGKNNEHEARLYRWGWKWITTAQNSQEHKSLKESYQFELEGRPVLFVDRDPINETGKPVKKYPVYIVLVHSGTTVSKMIKNISHSEFSHASISFDSSLSKMYSFARKDPRNPFVGGFRYESIGEGFYEQKEIPYAVYMVPCTENQIKKMKKRLNYFIQNESKFKFDFSGLVTNYLGIVNNPEHRWFCSRFVADILNAGAPKNKPYVAEPSLQDPDDFKNDSYAHFIVSGDNLMKYDQKLVNRRSRKIIREEELAQNVQHESVVLDIDGLSMYETTVLQYHLGQLDESAIEDFIHYIKSFKLKFDSDGNIIIRRREYDQLDMHYRNSLRLIKSAEKAGDLTTVKDELCKLHYMINLITVQYLNRKASPKSDKIRKEMTDLRAVMTNVFGQHLKYVMDRDPQFNFNAYYNTTKYSQDIVVNQAAISAIGKTVATALL